MMKAGIVGRAEILGRKQQQGRRRQQTHHGRTQTHEDMLHHGVVLELHQELADEQHQDERREHHGESGRHAAQHPPRMPVSGIDHAGVAHVGGRIDAYRAGGHLADGHNVRELPARQPVVAVDHLALDEGNHGIAAAEAEQPDFEETIKEIQK